MLSQSTSQTRSPTSAPSVIKPSAQTKHLRFTNRGAINSFIWYFDFWNKWYMMKTLKTKITVDQTTHFPQDKVTHFRSHLTCRIWSVFSTLWAGVWIVLVQSLLLCQDQDPGQEPRGVYPLPQHVHLPVLCAWLREGLRNKQCLSDAQKADSSLNRYSDKINIYICWRLTIKKELILAKWKWQR